MRERIMSHLLAYALLLLGCSCCGMEWKELTKYHDIFKNYRISAEETVSMVVSLIENTTSNSEFFFHGLESRINPSYSMKHECWPVFLQFNDLYKTFKVELVKLQTPLLKRKVDIEQRLTDIPLLLLTYQSLANNWYEGCLLNRDTCVQETENWLKKKLASFRCRMMTLCDQEEGHSVAKRSNCAPGQFDCRDGNCLPAQYICDGVIDCINISDEKNCPVTPFPITPSPLEDDIGTSDPVTLRSDPLTLQSDDTPKDVTKCDLESGKFLCSDLRCISLSAACDGTEDCEDGSDEGYYCDRTQGLCPNGCTLAGGVCWAGPRGAICLSGCPQGLIESGGLCLPNPEPPANLAELLEGTATLMERYSGSVGYLKRKVITDLEMVLNKCKGPEPISKLSGMHFAFTRVVNNQRTGALTSKTFNHLSNPARSIYKPSYSSRET